MSHTHHGHDFQVESQIKVQTLWDDESQEGGETPICFVPLSIFACILIYFSPSARAVSVLWSSIKTNHRWDGKRGSTEDTPAEPSSHRRGGSAQKSPPLRSGCQIPWPAKTPRAPKSLGSAKNNVPTATLPAARSHQRWPRWRREKPPAPLACGPPGGCGSR